MGIQERWHNTFSKLVSKDEPNGRSCPQRKADESETDYLRRLSRIGKRYIPKSEEIYSVTFRRDTADPLPDAVVEKYSELVRQAIERNLYRTDNMQPNELREIMIVDENGLKWRHFVGPDCFVKGMGSPCRLVIDGLGRKHSWFTTMPPQGADAATRRAASGGW
jgi:hypothetical protein